MNFKNALIISRNFSFWFLRSRMTDAAQKSKKRKKIRKKKKWSQSTLFRSCKYPSRHTYIIWLLRARWRRERHKNVPIWPLLRKRIIINWNYDLIFCTDSRTDGIGFWSFWVGWVRLWSECPSLSWCSISETQSMNSMNQFPINFYCKPGVAAWRQTRNLASFWNFLCLTRLEKYLHRASKNYSYLMCQLQR